MMNLRLLSKLQASDSVSLILVPDSGDTLQYYLISRSVAYEIVCTGMTSGTIPSGMISFDIRMASVIPLIEKGFKFRIEYTGDGLRFVSEDERTVIVPSYVESNDTQAARVIEKCMQFSDALDNQNRLQHQIETVQEELQYLKNRHSELTLMQLSGGPSENPFGPMPTEALDKKYQPEIAEKEKQLNDLLKKSPGIEELDLSPFTDIANAAARAHNLVDLCGDYAVLSLKTSFMLQKAKCPIQSIQGQLFHQLLRDGNGKGFYLFDDEMIYLNDGKERALVFVAKYLPNNDVDSSIVTRGAVEEKYSIQLKGILSITSLVKSHFPNFSMDMGNGRFILGNDLGEQITMKFEVTDSKTVAMVKMMRGEPVQGGITMATIDVPPDVQPYLSLFKEELTVYVKHKKIIFQNKGLYIVFGR